MMSQMVCKLHFPEVFCLFQIIHKKQDQDSIRSAELYEYFTCGQIPMMGYLTVHVHVIVHIVCTDVYVCMYIVCPCYTMLLNKCAHNLYIFGVAIIASTANMMNFRETYLFLFVRLRMNMDVIA